MSSFHRPQTSKTVVVDGEYGPSAAQSWLQLFQLSLSLFQLLFQWQFRTLVCGPWCDRTRMPVDARCLRGRTLFCAVVHTMSPSTCPALVAIAVGMIAHIALPTMIRSALPLFALIVVTSSSATTCVRTTMAPALCASSATMPPLRSQWSTMRGLWLNLSLLLCRSCVVCRTACNAYERASSRWASSAAYAWRAG
jgi:hypothetical protein